MITTNTRNKLLATCFDLGAGNSASRTTDGRSHRTLESPTGRSQILSAVYKNPDNGEEYIDTDALVQGYAHPEYIAMQWKANIPTRPHEKLYFNGTATAAEILTTFLQHLRLMLLSMNPPWKRYQAFGGSEEGHRLGFTLPSAWGFEPMEVYRQAIVNAGFGEPFSFVQEPTAANRSLFRDFELAVGTKSVTADIGTYSHDMAFSIYSRGGAWEQIAKPKGEAFAGMNFTHAVFEAIGKEFGIPIDGAFDDGGFNLCNVSPEHRLTLLACWEAAEIAKIKSCTKTPVCVPLNLPSGRELFRLDPDRAAELYKPGISRVADFVAHALDDSELDLSDIEYIAVCGGTANLPNLVKGIAEAIGRDPDDPSIVHSSSSETLIASGGATHVYFGEQVATNLFGGLVLQVRNKEGGLVNRLFIEANSIIPKDGLTVSQAGFSIDTRRSRELFCFPAALKEGVRAKLQPGSPTYVDDASIVELEAVYQEVDWPPGEHRVEIGIQVHPTRDVSLIVSAPDLKEYEPFKIPLVMRESNDTADASTTWPYDVVLLVDCSGSMRGSKMDNAKQGAYELIEVGVNQGWKIGLVRFPHGSRGASLICGLTADKQTLESAVDSISVGGGTEMDDALDTSKQALTGSANGIVILITDGMPADRAGTISSAEAVKQAGHRLFCVGIGRDVDKAYLTKIASSPNDYYAADQATDIVKALGKIIAELQELAAYYYDNYVPDVAIIDDQPDNLPMSPDDDDDDDWENLDDYREAI